MFDKTLTNKSGQRNIEPSFSSAKLFSKSTFMDDRITLVDKPANDSRTSTESRTIQTWLEDKESESFHYMDTNEIAARVGVGATHGCT
jgi:hypothetical protein